MKKLLFFVFLLPAFAFAQVSKTVPVVPATPPASATLTDPDAPSFKFSEETWDFGQIPQGVPASHAFTYDNAGKEPLVISQATASCGCTTPEWTKEPVLPGKNGTVKVTYNAAKEGTFTKTVTILSNTGSPKYLTIKGNVLPKAGETPAAPATTPK